MRGLSASRRLRAVTAFGGAALLTGFFATTATASPPSPAAVVRLAAAQARHVSSFTATIGVTMKGSFGPQLGAFDLDVRGSIALETSPSLLADLKFSTFRFSFGGMSSGGAGLGGAVEMILTSKDVYISGIAPGGKWYKVPLPALAKQLGGGQLLRQEESASSLDASQLLAGATNVRLIGRGTLGGVQVTEYAGDCPKSSGPGTATTCTFRVWVDGHQQLRKVELTERGDGLTAGVSLQVTSVNRPVHVHIPPASDTVPLPGNLLIGTIS